MTSNTQRNRLCQFRNKYIYNVYSRNKSVVKVVYFRIITRYIYMYIITSLTNSNSQCSCFLLLQFSIFQFFVSYVSSSYSSKVLSRCYQLVRHSDQRSIAFKNKSSKRLTQAVYKVRQCNPSKRGGFEYPTYKQPLVGLVPICFSPSRRSTSFLKLHKMVEHLGCYTRQGSPERSAFRSLAISVDSRHTLLVLVRLEKKCLVWRERRPVKFFNEVHPLIGKESCYKKSKISNKMKRSK